MTKSNFKKQLPSNKKSERLSDELRGLDLARVLVVPVDVAKKSHKALAADYYGEILSPPFEFPNNRPGLDTLLSIVDQTARKIKAQKTVIAMEPTGHYYEPLLRALVELGRDVRLVNAYSVAVQRKGDLTWCKTDEIDLCAIGQAVLNNRTRKSSAPDATYANLLLTVRARGQDVAARSALKNQIKATCDRLLPGLSASRIFSDFWSGPIPAILEKYPTADALIGLGKSRLKTFLRGKRLRPTDQALAALIQLARDSFRPDQAAAHTLTAQLKNQLAQYKLLSDSIIFWEIQMTPLLAATPGVLLLSIPQISVTSAAEYIAELGNPASYRKAASAIRRAGLNPGRNQTGQWEGTRTPITKQGNPHLRAAVTKIATRLAQDNPFYNAYLDGLLAGIKNEKRKKERKKWARVVVGTHFIRHSFAMMRNRKLFAPDGWNGPALAHDPLKKLRQYLDERGAGEHAHALLEIAAKQLPECAPRPTAQTQCKPASTEAFVHIGEIIAGIRTRLETTRTVAQQPE